MRPPRLSRVEADAIAERVARALAALGGVVRELHVEGVAAGLFIQARVGDTTGACLIPHGFTASWDDVARSLVTQTQAETAGVLRET